MDLVEVSGTVQAENFLSFLRVPRVGFFFLEEPSRADALHFQALAEHQNVHRIFTLVVAGKSPEHGSTCAARVPIAEASGETKILAMPGRDGEIWARLDLSPLLLSSIQEVRQVLEAYETMALRLGRSRKLSYLSTGGSQYCCLSYLEPKHMTVSGYDENDPEFQMGLEDGRDGRPPRQATEKYLCAYVRGRNERSGL